MIWNLPLLAPFGVRPTNSTGASWLLRFVERLFGRLLLRFWLLRPLLERVLRVFSLRSPRGARVWRGLRSVRSWPSPCSALRRVFVRRVVLVRPPFAFVRVFVRRWRVVPSPSAAACWRVRPSPAGRRVLVRRRVCLCSPSAATVRVAGFATVGSAFTCAVTWLSVVFTVPPKILFIILFNIVSFLTYHLNWSMLRRPHKEKGAKILASRQIGAKMRYQFLPFLVLLWPFAIANEYIAIIRHVSRDGYVLFVPI